MYSFLVFQIQTELRINGFRDVDCFPLWRENSAQNTGEITSMPDEGRPLGTGLQEQVSNHLRRLWSKAMVVSAEGKGLARTRSGDRQEEDCKETTMEVSKA